MPRTCTITVPLPSPKVAQNARCHWIVKAKATKAQRLVASLACRNATAIIPPMAKASVKVHAYFKTRRHPDPANFIGSLKATFDGLQDGGVIADDKGLWPERPEFFTDKHNPRVVLTITEETE